MSEILSFLTGGVFNTLKDLILNIIQWIITFITNMVSIFLYPIINRINGLLPNIDYFNDQIDYVFTFARPYINFILDFCFITSPVLVYIIVSFIFRITLKNSTYVKKLVIQWYEKLVP